MNTLPRIFQALSDETRLRIINLLYGRELCVCDILETLQITQTKASRHLSYLKNAGLVSDRKNAQWVFYSLLLPKEAAFLPNVITSNLRKTEPYQSDLTNLALWLKRKNKA